MKKQRIVIASVLKPVDDTRMLEKMGMTLQSSGEYEVFITGYPSQHSPSADPIHLLPLDLFKRISLGRFLAPFKIVKKIHQVKPEILIVNTHELLIVAIVTRILWGTRIFYDIRENYYRNILFSEAFQPPLNLFLALAVRGKEKLASPFFSGFFLAEKGYSTEMSFFGNRAITLENKAVISPGFKRTESHGKTRLLMSGTLAESTGIFEAIRLAKSLYEIDPSIELTLMGYCARADVLKKIHAGINGSSFITLVGGDRLIPHREIVQAIFSSDFGIVCYPTSPHTENSIPTKLYEYLAYSLPILLQRHPPWLDLCAPYKACISIDFQNIHFQDLLKEMQSTSFYTRKAENVSWTTEGQILLDALSEFKKV